MRHLRERPTVMKRWVDGVAGRAVLPEARARQRAGVAADGDRHVPQRPPRARARAQRRRASRLGREPRRDRLEPVAGAPRRTSTIPTSCASISTPARACRSRRCARSRWACARCSRSTACVGFPKTSGSRGIHMYVRIEPEQSFEEVRRAALALAREVERRMPGRATSRWWKEEREGVFIDYNQNARDRTVASAYSVRAVPDARVSCPLEWEEVADVEPAELRCDTVPARLRERGDPSADDRRARRAPRRRCSSSPRATSARASATRPGRRTSASRRASPRACSRAGRDDGGRGVSLAARAAAQAAARALAQGAAGGRGATATRSSSTASAAWRSSTATRCSCSRATASRSGATSPSSCSPPAATCSTARSSCATRDGREDFDALGQRIHPAASRIERLAARRPPCTWPSTCSRARTSRCSSCPSSSAARRSSSCSRASAFARRARRADGDAPTTPERARDVARSTPRARSPRSAPRPTGRASARAW